MSDDARAEALEKASMDSAVEGLKALLVLNGGACIALLAFLSATMEKEHTIQKEAAFVSGATEAPLFFALGAGLAVVTCLFAYLTNQSYASYLRDKTGSPSSWTAGERLNSVSIYVALASMLCFFIGVGVIWWHAR